MTGPEGPAPSTVPTKGQIAVTDRTVPAFNPHILASALDVVVDLMRADRVVIGPEYDTALSATIDAVRINVTACPAERDELVAALGDPQPYDWQGEGGHQYRDWRGVLLTMPTVVYETLPGPTAAVESEPPARDPAGDIGIVEGDSAEEQYDNAAARYDADEAEFVPSPSPVPSCPGAPAGCEAACGEPGPHGAHALGDEPAAVIVIRPSTPVDPDWAERAGLEPADATHWADPATAAAFRLVAVGKARLAFRGRTFTTPTGALAAIDAWQGRGMLTDGDVAQLAGELLEIPPTPNPAAARPFVRWPLVGRRRTPGRHGTGQLIEHITGTGPVA